MLRAMTLPRIAFALALSALPISARSIALQESAAPARGLRALEPGAFDGYTLLSPLRSGSTFLVDLRGEVVHRWDVGVAPGNMAYLLDGGSLLRPVRIDDHPTFFGGGIAGRIQELDWNGEVLWDFVLADERRISHHDLEVLPNGNVLAIVWEHRTREQAIALGRDPRITSEKGWWPDALLELEPVRPGGARIVWEWHALDHLVQDRDPSKPGHGSIAENPGRLDVNFDLEEDAPPPSPEELRKREAQRKAMRELGYTGGDDDEPPPSPRGRPLEPDWTHTNGIDHHPELDLIVMSSPRADEIWVIDHSTTTEQARGNTGGRWGRGGRILYRWGNPKNHGAGDASDRKLFGQHDPQWVLDAPAGELRVTLFNNGNGRPGGEFSSVDELVLPFDRERGFALEKGEPFGPAEPAWSYSAPERGEFYSFFISGAQRLANGNTLVCSGAQGRLFEVDRDGRIVWEWWNPLGGELEHNVGKAGGERKSPVEPHAIFQATRIPKDHPGLRGKELGTSSR
jgi:hypothetical protein